MTLCVSALWMSRLQNETTPLQKLNNFKQALKSTFAEPPEVKRHHLASEFSMMKQRVTESMDRSLRFSLQKQPSPPR